MSVACPEGTGRTFRVKLSDELAVDLETKVEDITENIMSETGLFSRFKVGLARSISVVQLFN